jgi:acetyl-CoA C-acetyltransferase
VALDPRTPVLVGAAVAGGRTDDPAAAPEAVALMTEACERAARDAGDSGLVRRADMVLTPRGSWPYRDPGHLVANRLGNTRARTLVADIGILQTTLFDRAASAIAAGEMDVAIIVGGEARWRQVRGAVTGVEPAVTNDDAAPDVLLQPDGMIISAEEIAAGLVTAVSHYAMIENARRAADGQTIDEHQRTIAELWSRFSQVAAANPAAWNREPMPAAQIRQPGPGNRPLAFPYNKWHCSQWNVDQASCVLMCSVGAARGHGIPPDRWVFPHAIAESNLVVPLSQRRQPHRCSGFSIAGARAMSLAGTGPDSIAHVDLYSCFPVAVRVQAAELGFGPDRQLTVTGGMAFAGGPLNNYVLQAVVAMAGVLRADPGSTGLVTAVSGMLTKQGVGVWSGRPPDGSYRSVDVSREVEAADDRITAMNGAPGQATVSTYTVVHTRDGQIFGAVIATLADGTRAVATTGEVDTTAAMTEEEWCGRGVELDGDGGFRPD